MSRVFTTGKLEDRVVSRIGIIKEPSKALLAHGMMKPKNSGTVNSFVVKYA